MQWTGLNELREKFLEYFESKQHLRLPSFSLIPQGDNSLLLINSGMAPMKKYFTGEVEPPRRRVTTCQKCIRTGDIENVGYTDRHGTYFEMLGNFSFGDYFKREAISFAWEFFTQVLEMPKEKLYISVYENDDEAWDIWTKEIGVEESHMKRLGKEDNFWEHGSGPCGPCSEIYFDRARSTAAASPPAAWAATATALWKCGTWCFPSLTTTATATTPIWCRRTSTPAWAWSAWPASCRTWTTCSWWTPCRTS